MYVTGMGTNVKCCLKNRDGTQPIIDWEHAFPPKVAYNSDVVAWNGDDLEMTAELVQELAEQTMTPADFAAFLKRNDLTQEAAAMILGRSRRQIGYYLTTGPIPRVVALACYGFEAQKRAHEQSTEHAARYG